jgi:CRISPR type III-A-associated protein Csm2
MNGLEKIKKIKCKNFEFDINYFDNDGNVKVDLFSDIAQNLVDKCFNSEYLQNEEGEYKCQGIKEKLPNGKKVYYGKNEYLKDCPKSNRVKEKISLNQMRKFYNEILNYWIQIENINDNKERLKKFRELLPLIKMEKAKANIAYQKKNINTNFKKFIDLNIDYIVDGYENDLEKSLEKFKIFVSLFEAVIAYSKGKIKEN